MRVHLKRLVVLLQHKWFVFWECVPERLFWLGLVHDLSKFLPVELGPYSRWFYGPVLKAAGAQLFGFEPGDTVQLHTNPGVELYLQRIEDNMMVLRQPEDKLAFDYAWNHHQKHNKHHWQYWVILLDHPQMVDQVTLPMPERYRREMLCDWRGAERSDSNGKTVRAWYLECRDKMILHPETRAWIEKELRI